jgi:hypothetical protein
MLRTGVDLDKARERSSWSKAAIQSNKRMTRSYSGGCWCRAGKIVIGCAHGVFGWPSHCRKHFNRLGLPHGVERACGRFSSPSSRQRAFATPYSTFARNTTMAWQSVTGASGSSSLGCRASQLADCIECVVQVTTVPPRPTYRLATRIGLCC